MSQGLLNTSLCSRLFQEAHGLLSSKSTNPRQACTQGCTSDLSGSTQCLCSGTMTLPAPESHCKSRRGSGQHPCAWLRVGCIHTHQGLEVHLDFELCLLPTSLPLSGPSGSWQAWPQHPSLQCPLPTENGNLPLHFPPDTCLPGAQVAAHRHPQPALLLVPGQGPPSSPLAHCRSNVSPLKGRAEPAFGPHTLARPRKRVAAARGGPAAEVSHRGGTLADI